MKKKTSLKTRLELAERRERDARRRLFEMDARLRRANAISDGSQIWVQALCLKVGEPMFKITPEDLKSVREDPYLIKSMPDGSYIMARKGYLGAMEEPDAPEPEKTD